MTNRKEEKSSKDGKLLGQELLGGWGARSENGER
jgi:hypothetical protein